MNTSCQNKASEIWLARVEDRLREELKQGDMPFLGLYSSHFDNAARDYFQQKALGITAPIQLFIRGLKKWPAVFATYLTVHVVEGYGRSGTGEVYPFVADALGVSAGNLDHQRRVMLSEAYRKACIQLGLSVVPKGSSSRPYVDEYLRQAGVPIKYLAQLTAKMESHAARLGIPDLDDPESVTAWQEQLGDYLGPPISRTIPRAIETDETAYYTVTYLRVREYQSAEECQNETESAIYGALSGSSRQSHTRTAQIPELQWRHGSMGIQIPSGDNSEWKVSTFLEGVTSPFDIVVVAEDERQFVPLPHGFPLKVTVSGPTASFEFSVWEDCKNNKILLVDRLGRLRARGALGDDEIHILPGTYWLVTRWEPAEDFLESTPVASDPAVFESLLTIKSGETLSLRRGPASIAISGKTVVAMEWQGLSRTGVLGEELLASNDLSIVGTIPEEIESAAPGMFEIVITAKGIDCHAEVPIETDSDQRFSIELNQTLSTWPPGVFRLGIVIRRRDIPNRSFARMSGIVWNGLSSTDGILFKCKSKAAFEGTRIARDRCENVRFDEDSLTFRDNEQRYFRTVFEISRTESVSFTWLVPGIFLTIAEVNGHNVRERPLAKGAVIQVEPSSRSALTIYSTLEGMIAVGSYRKAVTAASISGMQLYLAPILEHMSADDRLLQFIGETGVPIPLLRVITPHQFISAATHRTGDTYKVSLEIMDDIDEISIDTMEMITGKGKSIDLRVNVLESATGRPLEKVWATSLGKPGSGTGGGNHLEINWDVNDWEVGAYVFRLRAKAAERWGELVNARGDVFVGSMIVSSAMENPLEPVQQRPTAELLDIFRRFTEFLLECYAEESWSDVKWIAQAWNDVAQGLDINEPQVLIRLSILALRRAPEHSARSWVPISSVAGTRLDVFAQPAEAYQRLPSGDLKGLGLLKSLGEFGPNDQENLSREDLFSSLVFLGFENGPSVATGAKPVLSDFSLNKFSQIGQSTGESERLRIRRSEEWSPGPGIFLGAKHYWWAVSKLESRFHAGLMGNEHRRGNVLRLASRLKACTWRGRLPVSASRLLEDQLSLGLLCQQSVDSEISQDEENIAVLIDLLSATAFACRYAARKGDFLTYFESSLAAAINANTASLRMYLGYALYIGIDVFLYYLLLWEFVLSRDFQEESRLA